MLRIEASTVLIRNSYFSRATTNLFSRLASTHTKSDRNINMTDRFDGIEKKFGIAAYASPHEGFAAVVKARYSDFVVHEGKH